MKTICMLVLVLGVAALAGAGCKASAEVGDTMTNIAPGR
jgi:hypothetical protein